MIHLELSLALQFLYCCVGAYMFFCLCVLFIIAMVTLYGTGSRLYIHFSDSLLLFSLSLCMPICGCAPGYIVGCYYAMFLRRSLGSPFV